MAKKNFVLMTFAGDDKSLSATLGKVGGAADKTGSRLGKLGTIAKVGAVAGLAALAGAAKLGFDELADGAKKSAQTAAVLKSTGGAAGVTQKQVEGLALALSKKSGVDDQAIQSGQNMLLTFTNIRNEAGKGNKVFDDATSILTDMSVAMGTDMKSQAIQLGKALNDPIKGVTALSDVGVTFTDTQKKMIAQMVATGNTAGAQQVILKELNKEFGGSAAAAGQTLPGQLAILKNSFADVAAGLVATLLPGIKALVSAGGAAIAWMQSHETTTKVLVIALGALATGILAVNVATKAWAAAQVILNVAMRANPLGLIITAIALVAAGLVIAYKKSETFRDIVQGAFRVAATAVAPLKRALDGVITAIRWIVSHMPGQHGKIPSGTGVIGGRPGSYGAGAPGVRPHGGGIVPGPPGTPVAAVLQAGERVIPMKRAGARGDLGGGGVTNIFHINALDPGAAASAVFKALEQYERRNGQQFARA